MLVVASPLKYKLGALHSRSPGDYDPPREELIDITGPEGESLFCRAKQWLLAECATDLQASLDATWVRYKSIDDERLLALVAALCVEGALDGLLVGFALGFGSCISDTDSSSRSRLGLRALCASCQREFSPHVTCCGRFETSLLMA